MIHLVCDCGALVSTAPTPGAGGKAACGVCGSILEVPDPGALGIRGTPDPPAPLAPDPATHGAGGATPPAAPRGPRPFPTFDQDARLDLLEIEGQARTLLHLGRIVGIAALAGAVVALALPGLGLPARMLLASAAGIGGVAAWAAIRGARTAALAVLVLAERQRDLARLVARAVEGEAAR